MSEHAIRFTLNGAPREVTVPAERLLVDLLRDDLRVTGTKDGCSVGVCGLCTVQVDGAPMSACLLLATQVDGAAVRTVEGLGDGPLTPLQDAFVVEGGFQCGICTSGQLMAADALLRAKPDATAAEVNDWMMGNLCRCTGYYGIQRAIATARDSA
ncbi:MAG: aerobic carbon-monoxide dehydrogenase small subunit [Chloroflexota bacterium]|jgi:aerobic-type carbon monoxide dehydrogenase small subunit (CoxS/CutS family)|nr:aerobic carbon-monoxide dehydrogenase small subunit [Chloroflexota bacterium]